MLAWHNLSFSSFKFLSKVPYIKARISFLPLIIRCNYHQDVIFTERVISVFISQPRTYMKCKRYFSSNMDLTNKRLVVKEFGDPIEVCQVEECVLSSQLTENQVIAKVLASPVNPADINTIQGVYAIKPAFPFVAGNEAVMEIVSTGSNVSSLQTGDHVIPKKNALGTWQTFLTVNEDDLIKIPKDIDVITAATISVNPCTAYRMLTDFVTLKEGDVVIQNCANSAVGQAVIQICAARGIRTINVVRGRPNLDELDAYLKSLGADIVLTESDLRSSDKLKMLGKPILGLNGVSGKSATELLRRLAPGGTLVTYGGMSRQPLTVPVSNMIFNDLTLKGFWMTRWNKDDSNHSKRLEMLELLFSLVRQEKFKPPLHEMVSLENFHTAFKNAMPSGGMVGKKQILNFQ